MAAGKERYFDGIICFGGQDWWYHNRGHNDIQLMRQFSRLVPVLYVNSIGMRMPSIREGPIFLRRIIRKLKSIFKGMKMVQQNFGVYSPLTVPGPHNMLFAKWFLSFQIKFQARRMGIRHPLLWIFCPPAQEVVDCIGHVALLYTRFDRYESFPGVDVSRIKAYDKILKNKADLTNFTSMKLCEEGKDECRHGVYVDHGVDYKVFSEAGINPREPEGLKNIPHPRIGFIGGIDEHTFDKELFLKVAEGLPGHSFVMVGGCTLPKNWCALANVYLLGKREYEDVPYYMAACDVLIMTFADNEWIMASNPVKTKEYLAVGRPVVSTRLPELKKYEGLISIADNAEEFISAIKKVLAHPPDAAAQRECVKRETWLVKSEEILGELKKLGVLPDRSILRCHLR